MKATQDYFSCSGFTTKKRRCCSSHYIRRVVLEQMVLDTIQTVTAFVSTHEREFVEMQEVKTSSEFQKNAVIDKKNLAKSEKRVKELDILIQQLFEKNALGVISDERFMSLSKVYEQEQQTLGANVEALRKQLARQQEDSSNVGKFLEKARKYSNVAELSKPMLNELVERVEVHMRSERYSKGVQGMTLHFNYVGDVSDLFLAVISQEEEQPKPQAKRRPRPQVVKQLQEIPIMATVKS
jgi:predicted transcriptional regulator